MPPHFCQHAEEALWSYVVILRGVIYLRCVMLWVSSHREVHVVALYIERSVLSQLWIVYVFCRSRFHRCRVLVCWKSDFSCSILCVFIARCIKGEGLYWDRSQKVGVWCIQ